MEWNKNDYKMALLKELFKYVLLKENKGQRSKIQ